MEKQQAKRATAFGKIIISGEHAVVYARPALAMAARCQAAAEISCGATEDIRFNVPNLDYHLNFSEKTLASMHDRLLRRYHQFLENEISIQDVLDHPIELIPFAFACIWKRAGFTPLQKLSVDLSITIPVGCGMGSSAAVGIAIIKAAMQHFGLAMSAEDILQESMTCERLMHGHPSGVDSNVSFYGGAFRFEDGKLSRRPIPKWPLNLINTGRPSPTTGECVSAVKNQFAQSDPIWNEFEAVTNAIDEKLGSPVDGELLDLIKENHRLLRRIGVVPDCVHDSIMAIESQGAAAKVCGAGACRGDSAGVIMVVGECDLEPILENPKFKWLERD